MLHLGDLLPDFGELGRMIKLSGVGVLQMLIGTTSWIGMVRVLAPFGSGVLAGYTVSIRVIIFALLPCWGLSNAAATLVGQSLGAGKPERAAEAVRLASIYNFCVLGAIGAGFELFAAPIVGIFSQDPAIVPWALSSLRIVSLGFAFYGWGMVLTAALNGAGDTWTPTVLNLICFWAFSVPFGWWLSRGSLGPKGVFIAISASFVSLTCLSFLVFRRGRWRTRVV